MGQREHEIKLFWEQLYRSPVTKAVAIAMIVVLTVVFTGKEFSLSRAIGNLNYDSTPAKAKKPTKPAEKLHAAALELQELLAVQNKRDLSDKQTEKARSARAQIVAQLKALDRQFALDRVKLFKLHADNALQRLAAIEKKTASLKRSLTAALAKVPTDGGLATGNANKASKVLTAMSPEKPQQPLSSDLSFGIKNAKPRSVSLSAGITPAYSSPTSGEEASPLPREPQPEDLEETPETRVTPAIEQLATQLNHDPVQIYEYVRNNIRFEPYYGIRKGADQTLAEKAGSDADQAALLIALLRESGVHARFVQGVAELPAQKAANWLGINTAAGERLDAAPEILWSGGIPTNTTRVSGRLTKVRFNHIWAEGYVADEAYRGVDEGIGGKAWVALDASIKETELKAPVADFKDLLGPAVDDWAQSFIDGSQAMGENGMIAPPPAQTVQDTQELFDHAQEVLRDNGIGDGATLSDVIGSREIRQTTLSYAPSTTPFRALAVAGELRSLPDSLNASVSLMVSGSDPMAMPTSDPEQADDSGFDYTAKTLDLANKRITVSYVPATDEDEEIVDAYHGLLNAPSYAAALIPVLRVDGRVVARGHRAVSTGYTQNFRITYRMPGYPADIVENPVYVGTLSAVVLSLGRMSSKQLDSVVKTNANSWNAANESNSLTDAVAGTSFQATGMLYFLRNRTFNDALSRTAQVKAQRQLSGALVATDLSVSTVGGFPVLVRLSGLTMDVDQDAQSVTSLGATTAPTAYARASGIRASSSESDVFEQTLTGAAASTARVFQVASADRIPFYQFNESNSSSAQALLNLPAYVEDEIALAAQRDGTTVIVPRDTVTVGSWTGEAYIIESGTAADFRISGGSSGGAWSGPDGSNLPDLVATDLIPSPQDFEDALLVIKCAEAIDDQGDLINLTIAATTALILLAVAVLVPGGQILLPIAIIDWLAATAALYSALQYVSDYRECVEGGEST